MVHDVHLNTATAPLHLKLAQHHYVARVQELRQLIAAEEARFKCVTEYGLVSMHVQQTCHLQGIGYGDR